MYNPLSFDRDEYLQRKEEFETLSLPDCDNEMTEFSEDAEDMGFEVAYLRYHYAKIEKERDRLMVLATKHCSKDHHDWLEILRIAGDASPAVWKGEGS